MIGNQYEGLNQKYVVLTARTGERVENCFVLRPDKDSAAVAALRAYARFTENKTLADDIINRVGEEENEPLTLDELNEIYDSVEGSVWVKFQRSCWPAILDKYDGDLVAVWCANDNEGDNFLSGRYYGETWLAYRHKPKEE